MKTVGCIVNSRQNSNMIKLSNLIFSLNLRHAAGLWVCVVGATFANAQAPVAAPVTGMTLPNGASTKRADEFLATLRPPTTFKALIVGNDLLLEVPDIAKAGSVKAKVVSTIARTDGMWLVSLHPTPDSGTAMFVSMQFEIAALPEATLNLQLYKTQPVLLVARAGGRYYGIYREVKVGQSGLIGASK